MTKRVLITGGPSNECIDKVMKITNMSTGKIAVDLASYFLSGDFCITLILNKAAKPYTQRIEQNSRVHVIWFETTEELENAIKQESENNEYDIVIHSAAVADYKPEFSFRMEDMAQEISEFILENLREINESFSSNDIYNEIFNILTNPACKVNDSTKISSNEEHLTVKLGLTTKIIYNLRKWFPNAIICGFKLLEDVSEKELVDAAMRVQDKSCVDVVFANDLAELRKGNKERLVVTRKGYSNIRVIGAEGIYNLLNIIFENKH